MAGIGAAQFHFRVSRVALSVSSKKVERPTGIEAHGLCCEEREGEYESPRSMAAEWTANFNSVQLTESRGTVPRVDRTSIAQLSEQIKSALSDRDPKILYIKADAHVAYSSIVGVMDSVRAAGVKRVGLLTAKDSDKPGTLVPPNGLEMLILSSR